MKSSRRPTAADVARAAGVSTATVDRVIHGRLPVSSATAKRVLDAALALGYHFAPLIAQGLRRSNYTLALLLQKPTSLFYPAVAGLIRQVAAHRAPHSISVEVQYLESQAPRTIVSALEKIADHVQVIAMVTIDDPSVGIAVSRLRERGIGVISLFSESAVAHAAFLGCDNIQAGRTAGWLVARTAPKPGKVAVVIGSHRFLGHELREQGLRSYFRAEGTDFELVETLFNLEDTGLAEEATLELLRRHPDLAGLYLAGGGTEGAIAALASRSSDAPIGVVCSEMTPATRDALLDGHISAIVATPLEFLANRLIDLVVANETARLSGRHLLPLQIITPENIGL